MSGETKDLMDWTTARLVAVHERINRIVSDLAYLCGLGIERLGGLEGTQFPRADRPSRSRELPARLKSRSVKKKAPQPGGAIRRRGSSRKATSATSNRKPQDSSSHV